MHIIIDTATNSIVGYASSASYATDSNQLLLPGPEGFDREFSTEWSYSGGMLTHDPLIALNRAKAQRIARIKTEAGELIASTDWKLQRAREREAAGWATLAEVDAALTEREAVRRSSGAAELAVDALNDVASVQGFAWAVDVPVVTPRRLTHTKFIELFTDTELQNILATAASSAAMGAWWKRFELANVINMVEPEAQTGLRALEFAGLIGVGRAEQLINPST